MTTPKSRDLFEFLARHARGSFLAEANSRWRELLDSVATYRASGSMVITIGIKPTKGRRFDVTPTVTLKLPKPDSIVESYYLEPDRDTGAAALSLLDPDQEPLFRDPEPVAPARAPLTVVNNAQETAS